MAKKKVHYVDSSILEDEWLAWMDSPSDDLWNTILSKVYKICLGAALKFTSDENEREELAHDAFAATIGKIMDGRLRFIRGRGKAFNLLSTAAIRHMQSRLNKESAVKRVQSRYAERQVGTIRRKMGAGLGDLR